MLALGGCSTFAPTAVPTPPMQAVPPAWSAADAVPAIDATPLAVWWQRFGDDTLAALIDDALAANTDLRGAQAALRQARALRDVQAAALRPSVGGSASAQRGTSSGNAPPSNAFGIGLDAGWELDVFGRIRSAVAASDADVQTSAATLADVRVSIAAEVALAYLQLRGAQGRLAVARSNLAAQEETLQIAGWRAQAGLATSLEVEQQRATTEQTRATLPLLAVTAGQAAHALAVLTGRAPAALDGRLAAAAPVPQPPQALALAFPADTLRQRPDVRAAGWRVQAAALRVTQAERARLPSLRLAGSLGLNALTVGALGSGSALAASVLAGVSVPLIDGGALRAQVRSQEAALDQARVGYEAAVLVALQEVEDALIALRGDRERLATQRRAAEAAGNAALLARQRYESGLVDFQTVLDAQRTLLSTQDAVATSEANVAADHVRLYKALGGGWDVGAADAVADGGLGVGGPNAGAAVVPSPSTAAAASDGIGNSRNAGTVGTTGGDNPLMPPAVEPAAPTRLQPGPVSAMSRAPSAPPSA